MIRHRRDRAAGLRARVHALDAFRWRAVVATSPRFRGRGAADLRPAERRIGQFIASTVALVLWVLGAAAYVRVHDSGIHRRCYLRHDDAWSDIRSIELRTVSHGRLSNRRMIRVDRHRGRHWLAPATGGTKYNEAFARQLLAAARARGITVSSSDRGGFDE